MTAMDAIREADRLRPNSFPAEDKLRWLDRLEQRIREELLKPYEGLTPETEESEANSPDRKLTAEAPFDEMYIHWLCAQMALYEQELESFNAANALFEALYGRFRNELNRRHRPRTAAKRFF